jgi:hypothetical protein
MTVAEDTQQTAPCCLSAATSDYQEKQLKGELL